jgi:hypothetical protein
MLEYIQNFWNPLKGHTVEYKNVQYTIDKIIDGVQVKLNGHKRIAWVQDISWAPSIEEIDKDVVQDQLKAKIIGTTINVVSKTGKVCYFSRPDNLQDYENLIREMRVFLTIN